MATASLMAIQKAEVTSPLEKHKCVWDLNSSLPVVLQVQLDKTRRQSGDTQLSEGPNGEGGMGIEENNKKIKGYLTKLH